MIPLSTCTRPVHSPPLQDRTLLRTENAILALFDTTSAVTKRSVVLPVVDIQLRRLRNLTSERPDKRVERDMSHERGSREDPLVHLHTRHV